MQHEHKIPLKKHSLFYLLSLTIGSKDIPLRLDLYKRCFSTNLVFSFPGQLPIPSIILAFTGEDCRNMIRYNSASLVCSADHDQLLRHQCATSAASAGSNPSTTFSKQPSEIAFHAAQEQHERQVWFQLMLSNEQWVHLPDDCLSVRKISFGEVRRARNLISHSLLDSRGRADEHPGELGSEVKRSYVEEGGEEDNEREAEGARERCKVAKMRL